MNWEANANYVKEMCGDDLVDFLEGYYICPECGELIFEDEWPESDLVKFVCPICEWEGD